MFRPTDPADPRRCRTAAIALAAVAALLAIVGLIAQAAYAGVDFQVLHTFDRTYPEYPSFPVAQGADGALYGVTSNGGAYGNGSIYRVSSSGAVTVLHSFSPADAASLVNADGDSPCSALILGADGDLYGATNTGGANGVGVVYKIDSSGDFSVVASFPSYGPFASAGPTEMVLAPDGSIYGASAGNGTSLDGNVFRISPGGAYSDIHDFTVYPGNAIFSGTLAVDSAGAVFGPAFDSASTGLFEITPAGQYMNIAPLGTIPRSVIAVLADPAGGVYVATSQSVLFPGNLPYSARILHVDDSGAVRQLASFPNAATGPFEALMSLALGPNGSILGTTASGQVTGDTVFEMSRKGALKTVVSFTGSSGARPGYGPFGMVAMRSGTLVGFLTTNGTSGSAEEFEILPGGVYRPVTDMPGLLYPLDGVEPPTLTLTADGGYFGVEKSGGQAGIGSIFEVLPGKPFAEVAQFVPTEAGDRNNVETAVGPGGSVYGVSTRGGAYGAGLLFHVPPDGSLSADASLPRAADRMLGVYAPLAMAPSGSMDIAVSSFFGLSLGMTIYSYSSQTGLMRLARFRHGGTGDFLQSSVAVAGNSVFGSSEFGGPAGDGFVWRISPTGAISTAPYNDSNSNVRQLVTTRTGRVYGYAAQYPTIFEVHGSSLRTVCTLPDSGVLGTYLSVLIAGRNGNLYGATATGGANGYGAIFSCTPAGVLTKLADLDMTTTGDTPLAAAVASTGSIYMAMGQSATADTGMIVKITEAGNVKPISPLPTGPGYIADVALTPAPDGNIYGVAGGVEVFVIHPANDSVALLHEFSSDLLDDARTNTDGSGYMPALLVRGDELVGSADQGGAQGVGDMYSLTITPDIAAPAKATAITHGVYALSCAGTDKISPKLTYTWATASQPAGVLDPVFTTNGTGAAKHTNVAVSAPGQYTFTCTITNGLGGSVQTSCSVDAT